jgi:hypothetical protein
MTQAAYKLDLNYHCNGNPTPARLAKAVRLYNYPAKADGNVLKVAYLEGDEWAVAHIPANIDAVSGWLALGLKGH